MAEDEGAEVVNDPRLPRQLVLLQLKNDVVSSKMLTLA